MSPQQKKIKVKVQFSEIYGKEIVNNYIETGTIHKKENKAYIPLSWINLLELIVLLRQNTF
jgi:hypothetical protein